jgi:hypothetical protein
MTGYLYYMAMTEMRRQLEGALVGSGPGPAVDDDRRRRIGGTGTLAGLRHLASAGAARVVAAIGGTGAGNRAGRSVSAVNRGCGS